MQNKLPIHEWLAAISLISILVLITIFSIWTHRPSFPKLAESEHHIVDNMIEVIVEGYVENPKHYRVEKGILVKELIALAKPLPEADLSRIKMGKKARDGDVFDIPKAEMITIYLKGAVEEEGPLLVRKGSSAQDLLQIAKFKPEANLKKLTKKRKLKNEETIYVPFRK